MYNIKGLLFFVILVHPLIQFINNHTNDFFQYFFFKSVSIFTFLAAIFVYAGVIYLLVSRRLIWSKLPVLKPFFLFLVWALVTCFYSRFTLISIRNFFELSAMFFLFILSANLFQTEKDLRNLIQVIITSLVIPLGVALVQVVFKAGTIDIESETFMRISGTFSHPNELAFYILMAIPFLIEFPDWSRSDSGRKLSKLFFLILFFLSIIVLVNTFTRSAWGGLVVELLLLWFLGRNIIKMVLPFFLILPFVWETLALRIQHVVTVQGNSLRWRLRHWMEIIALIKVKLLFGYGLGTSASECGVHFNIKPIVPHNDYLRIWMETGLVGLVLFLFFWLALATVTYKLFKSNSSNLMLKNISRAYLVALIGLMVVSFSDNIFNNSLLLWPVMALGGALCAAAKNQYLKRAELP